MSKFTKAIKHIEEKIIIKKEISREFKKIKNKKRKKIINSIVLSQEQKQQIDEFYKSNYGQKIPYDWHREFAAFTGKFDYKYIPEFIFLPIIERMFNDKRVSLVLIDKTLLPVFANGLDYIYTPKIIACQTNNLDCRYDNKLISFDELIYKIQNIGYCFIKPAKETNSGKGCRVLNIKKGIDVLSNKNMINILNEYKNNFIIQNIIKNSDSISKLHPQSLNTFRVITYMLNNKINVAPISLRIGAGNNDVDNAHAGGMFIHVNNCNGKGLLDKYAFTEFKKVYEKHPDTLIQFENYEIFNFDKIINAARRLHEERFSMLGMISFDFTLDNNENVVLIEANSMGQACWLPQEAAGKALFGDDTALILQMARSFIKKNKF